MTLASTKCLFCNEILQRQTYILKQEDFLICPTENHRERLITYCTINTLEIVGYDLTIWIENSLFDIQSYKLENLTIINKISNDEFPDNTFRDFNFYNVPKCELAEFKKLLKRLLQLSPLT